jgi:hypothetical protein
MREIGAAFLPGIAPDQDELREIDARRASRLLP